jgi:hypothetical protein
MGFHPETPADPDNEAFLCDPTEEPVEHSEFRVFHDANTKV